MSNGQRKIWISINGIVVFSISDIYDSEFLDRR